MNEPLMCPFCGGAELVEEEETELETEEEYWVIYHWRCMDCGDAFDKVIVRSNDDAFEDPDADDNTIWS